MKLFPFLCICLVLVGFSVRAQNPYIANITVLPSKPTENDIIKIAVIVQTGNPAKMLSITPTVVNGDIYVNACYGIKSMAGQVYTFKDTVTIGKLPDGPHKVVVKAYEGTDTNSCVNLFDSSTRTDTFGVLPLMPITQTILPLDISEDDSVKIAISVLTPNPANKISLGYNVLQNKITINSCFAKTQAISTPQLFKDTIVVGKLPDGKYQSVFTAYYSDAPDTTICNLIVDSTQVADSFSVAKRVVVKNTGELNAKVYPNPASNEVCIQLPERIEIDQVTIEDITGKLVKTVTGNKFSIAELPNGLYILQVQTNVGRLVQKVRKE